MQAHAIINTMNIWIEEIVIVEGKDDKSAFARVFQSFALETHGTAMPLLKAPLENISPKVILLTDPDGPGRRINAQLLKRIPRCKVALMAKKDCLGQGKVGVAYASPQAIYDVVMAAGATCSTPPLSVSLQELESWGLTGKGNRRRALCAAMGLPPLSVKQLKSALLHYPALLATLRKEDGHWGLKKP